MNNSFLTQVGQYNPTATPSYFNGNAGFLQSLQQYGAGGGGRFVGEFGAGVSAPAYTPTVPFQSQVSDYGVAGPGPGVGSIPPAAPSSISPAGAGGGWLKDSGFFSTTDKNGVKTDGWGGMALGAAQGLANAYMGMKQYGIAKDTLAENKRQFALNYEAQRSTTNSALEDRQRARVASNPGAYQSVGDYMNQNGIKG